MECLHDDRAECWLCSDLDPRWMAWRLDAGLPIIAPFGLQRRRRKEAWFDELARLDRVVAMKSEAARPHGLAS